jgi:hypothetical protein
MRHGRAVLPDAPDVQNPRPLVYTDRLMILNFRHARGFHCESIVTRNLLFFQGLDVSEPLVFGIGSGLFFAHLPFYKLYDLPMTTFRNLPGSIFRLSVRRFGLKAVIRRRYRDPTAAMDEMDRLLDRGFPVGLQVGAKELPFSPWSLEQQFNAHQLVVFGRENGEYVLSDPMLAEPVRCAAETLKKARFAQGEMAPNGRMFYIVGGRARTDLGTAVRGAIRRTCFLMVNLPLRFVGIRGIRYLARQVTLWPARLGEDKARLYLAQLVRLQEEIGSGGAGFRYIYADFLKEASGLLNSGGLADFSREMTAIAERWRDSALVASRICKGRGGADDTYESLSGILLDCASREEKFFRELRGSAG